MSIYFLNRQNAVVEMPLSHLIFIVYRSRRHFCGKGSNHSSKECDGFRVKTVFTRTVFTRFLHERFLHGFLIGPFAALSRLLSAS